MQGCAGTQHLSRVLKLEWPHVTSCVLKLEVLPAPQSAPQPGHHHAPRQHLRWAVMSEAGCHARTRWLLLELHPALPPDQPVPALPLQLRQLGLGSLAVLLTAEALHAASTARMTAGPGAHIPAEQHGLHNSVITYMCHTDTTHTHMQHSTH